MTRLSFLSFLLFFPVTISAQITADDLLKQAAPASKEYVTLTQKAMTALHHDSLSQAEGYIKDAMADSPAQLSNALLYDYLGQIYERQGKGKQAMEAYNQGLEIAPEYEGLLMDRASLFLNIGNNDRALADYNVVVEHNRDKVEALFFRAYIYCTKRLYHQGRLDYEHIISLQPDHEQARLGLAILNDKDNRPVEAMSQIDALIQTYPLHANLYAIRGGMKQTRRDYEGALRDMSEAIRLQPTNPDFYISRALLFQSFKRPEQARTDFMKAVEHGASAQEVANMMEVKNKGKK